MNNNITTTQIHEEKKAAWCEQLVRLTGITEAQALKALKDAEYAINICSGNK